MESGEWGMRSPTPPPTPHSNSPLPTHDATDTAVRARAPRPGDGRLARHRRNTGGDVCHGASGTSGLGASAHRRVAAENAVRDHLTTAAVLIGTEAAKMSALELRALLWPVLGTNG